jgi:hypothetical protein
MQLSQPAWEEAALSLAAIPIDPYNFAETCQTFAYAALRCERVFRDEAVLVPYFFRDRAALFAWRDSALCDAVERGSRFSAASVLRERRADVAFFLRLWPLL